MEAGEEGSCDLLFLPEVHDLSPWESVRENQTEEHVTKALINTLQKNQNVSYERQGKTTDLP